MEPRCTCGAILVDGARFCHKCGKPQFEEDARRLNELEQASSPVQEPLQPQTIDAPRSLGGISFRNSRAVLISLLVAAGAMVCFLPIALVAAPLFPFFLCGVGFVAVYLYHRGLKEPLSTSAGARLGWMTGLWIFLVTAVLLAMTALVIASPAGWEQLRAAWSQVPQTAKLLDLSQHDLLVQMLIMLPFSFLLLTMLPGLGGILGAKLSARRR
ncbi:MAG: zinc ribbon domain-containing protein [Bryobacteraceae bacterium]